MKPSDYKISLDILESQSQYSLPMKKGDTARVVYITLREGGVPYEIGRDCFAVLSGRKPDGTVLENNCVIKGNTIIYTITPQTTSASGLVDCEIKLYGVDNGLICSARFSIIVDKRVVGDEEVESTSEFTALTELYGNVVTSENARVDAEVERVAAEVDRAKAEQKREANITQAIEDAEEATDKANNIADTLQTKLDNGEFKGEKGDKGDTPETDHTYNPKSTNAQSGVAVSEALSDVANAIKNTVSGSPIIIDDASQIKHSLDVKTTANETVYVRGKNLIPFNNKSYNNGKYVAGQTYTISGVSFTVNDNGSVYVVGTATNGSAMFVLSNNPTLEAGRHTVTLSGCPNTDCYIAIVTGSNTYYDYDSGVTAENVNIEKSRISFVVKSGATVDATFYPMLEFGDTVSEFTSPVGSCSATADENGVVNGLVSVAKEMSVFSETDESIECTYNKDTEKVLAELPQETVYRFNIEELSNTAILNSELKVLNFEIRDNYFNAKPVMDIDYALYTALQNTTTGEITTLVDIPAQYDNYIEVLGNSFNNVYDYSEPNICNKAVFGNMPIKLSFIGEELVNAEYCTGHSIHVYSNSSTRLAGYKAIGLRISIRLLFANETHRTAVRTQFIDPIFATNTHIGIKYTKPAPIVDAPVLIEPSKVRSEIELHNAGDLWFVNSNVGNVTKSKDGLAVVGYANTVSSKGNDVYVMFMVGETQNDVFASVGSPVAFDYNGKTYYYNATQYLTTYITDFGKCVEIPFNTSNEQTAKDLLDYYFMVE